MFDSAGNVFVYSTLTSLVKNNKNLKLNAQTIRNSMSKSSKNVYEHDEFIIRRQNVIR